MHLESYLESLLTRWVPGCESQWIGAMPAEIERIESHAGVPLPPFYRWFLTRMGRSMGLLTNPKRNLTVRAVLSLYDQGFIAPDPQLLLIGTEYDDIMPMHLFYDMRQPMRDDALVCSYPVPGGSRQNEFETLREMLAWSIFDSFRLSRFTQTCSGSINEDSGNVIAELAPLLVKLGFMNCLPAGPFLGLFERDDAALECTVVPSNPKPNYLFFEFGTNDKTILQSVLGTIAVETTLQIEVDEWNPPLVQ